LRSTMQFLGDQGRDALIARGILMDRDPAFIGPVTSVGNMYLGPFYYYFMVLPLMFSYPDPSGPAYAVAFVGVVTLALLFVLGKELVGEKTALLAMGLYAIAPIVIENVRFSWNPNIVPLFSLLVLWAVNKTMQGKYQYWVLIGLCAAILSQLHYLTLIVIGIAGIFWLVQLYRQIKFKSVSPIFIRSTGLAILIVMLSVIPILIYDVKHDFLNVRAFLSFFIGGSSSDDASHFRGFGELSAVFYAWIALAVRNMSEIFGIRIPNSAALISLLVGIYLVIKTWFNLRSQSPELRRGIKLIIAFFVIGIGVLSFYKESIFNHYLGFLFPISVLLLSVFLTTLWKSILLRPLVLVFVGAIVFFSFQNYPGQHILGMNVDVFKQTADEIKKRTIPGEQYDILLLSENNDFLGMNYRYFLTTSKDRPASEEDVHSFKRLFVIDEAHKENPLDTPQYKIAIWPNRDIIDAFSIKHGPNVVMLVR
ncbi:glycosyltransferase family 39 protein, partial [Candidatus Woesebacteria bacterium]|nr:glycosyltransferase family 39 protein [Candidatus Woesebacteria bacterium]